MSEQLRCLRCGRYPRRAASTVTPTRLCQRCFDRRWAYVHQRRTRGPVLDDISPAEIEARYQAAIEEIRRQRWSAHS